MDGPMKNILDEAMHRAKIGRQVTAARMVTSAGDIIAKRLGRPQDARVTSYREGTLVIACVNAAAAHALRNQQTELIDEIKRKLPNADLRFIQVRIAPQSM